MGASRLPKYCTAAMVALSLDCYHDPGDFLTKVKQIDSQSDLISMSNFASPIVIRIRSSVYIISIRGPCISIFKISAKLDPITYA